MNTTKAICLICKRKFIPSNNSAGKYCSQSCYQSFPKKKRSLSDRFWEKVYKTDGCWFWIAGLHGRDGGDNYGAMYTRKGRREKSHRVSWQINFGPIPEGKQILHSCDNPQCVRPDHLFLG